MAKVYFPRKDTFRRYEINGILFHSVLSHVHNLPMKRVPHKISEERIACILQRQKILFTRREYSIDKGMVTDVKAAASRVDAGIKIN